MLADLRFLAPTKHQRDAIRPAQELNAGLISLHLLPGREQQRGLETHGGGLLKYFLFPLLCDESQR